MGVEAARLALRSAPADARPTRCGSRPSRPPTSTRPTPPPSTPRCGSTTTCAALDFGGAQRSAVGALRVALAGRAPCSSSRADLRTGLPGGGDEAAGGDGAAAVLVGDDATRRCSPSTSARPSLTEEFLDRWRTPGDARSKVWEERFGETQVRRRWASGRGTRRSRRPSSSADDVDRVIVTGMHARAAARARRPARRRRRKRSSTTSARRRQHRRRPSRRCCSPPRSRPPSPGR